MGGRRENAAPDFCELCRTWKWKLHGETNSAEKSRIERALHVRGEDGETAIRFHPLQEIADLDVGIAGPVAGLAGIGIERSGRYRFAWSFRCRTRFPGHRHLFRSGQLLQNIEREIADAQRQTGSFAHECLPDKIFELANVARQFDMVQCFRKIGADDKGSNGRQGTMLLQEMLDERH